MSLFLCYKLANTRLLVLVEMGRSSTYLAPIREAHITDRVIQVAIYSAHLFKFKWPSTVFYSAACPTLTFKWPSTRVPQAGSAMSSICNYWVREGKSSKEDSSCRTAESLSSGEDDIELSLVPSFGPRSVQAERRSMAPNTPLDF